MRIERIVEPKKLFLAWQAPEHLKDRHRWAVAEILPRADGDATLRYITDDDEFRALNSDRGMTEMARLGYAGFPAFRGGNIHEKGVLSALLRRVPSSRRADYQEYLQAIGFAEGVQPSKLALLSHTEAKLPSDGFSVVDPLDATDDDLDTVLELAGSRYYLSQPFSNYVGQDVELRPEPENIFDKCAIQAYAEGCLLGYINRLQAPVIGKWVADRKIQAQIHRVNGSPERPRVYIFVRVTPTGDPSQIAA
jgi:hypothetical protein